MSRAQGSKDPGRGGGAQGASHPRVLPGTSQLRPGEPEGYRIPFNPRGTGCGAAMRSLAIGLRWARGHCGTPGDTARHLGTLRDT